ncbi:MAG: 8-oxo-dGTP diphosphatase MutT [Anaerolineae bacterium]
MQLKTLIANLLQRHPLLGMLGHRLIRSVQARFTAGAVGVILNEKGQILLLKHVYRPRYLWGLPGGYVARHENPADTVVRELLEETGLRVRVEAPLLVERGIFRDHLDFAFLCAVVQGNNDAMRLSSEILDYRWLRRDELPELLGFQQRAVDLALTYREEHP